MHVFDISADALLHCYAVDEIENGKAKHNFTAMKRVVKASSGGYEMFGGDNQNPNETAMMEGMNDDSQQGRKGGCFW